MKLPWSKKRGELRAVPRAKPSKKLVPAERGQKLAVYPLASEIKLLIRKVAGTSKPAVLKKTSTPSSSNVISFNPKLLKGEGAIVQRQRIRKQGIARNVTRYWNMGGDLLLERISLNTPNALIHRWRTGQKISEQQSTVISKQLSSTAFSLNRVRPFEGVSFNYNVYSKYKKMPENLLEETISGAGLKHNPNLEGRFYFPSAEKLSERIYVFDGRTKKLVLFQAGNVSGVKMDPASQEAVPTGSSAKISTKVQLFFDKDGNITREVSSSERFPFPETKKTVVKKQKAPEKSADELTASLTKADAKTVSYLKGQGDVVDYIKKNYPEKEWKKEYFDYLNVSRLSDYVKELTGKLSPEELKLLGVNEQIVGWLYKIYGN